MDETEHLTNEQIISVYAAYKEQVDGFWQDAMTLREAVEAYLEWKQDHGLEHD